MGTFVVGRVEGGSVNWLGPVGQEVVETVRVSARQWSVLWFIHRYQVEERQTPSLDEIAGAVWLSGPSAASYQVRQLERRGLLTRHGSRAITLNVRF